MKTDRRKLIKALTLGGGAVTVAKLPSTWSTPVVDSVTLPAHAQTTVGPVLSGGTTVTLDDGLFPGFRNFVRGPGNPLLDRLVGSAHAAPAEPEVVSTRISGYAERDLARGAGWWLVQILAHYDIELSSYYMAAATSVPERSPLDHMLKPAHAGGDPFPEACVSEVLWQTRLFIDLPDGDLFRSSWQSNVPIASQCGDLGIAADMPPENATVDMRIEDADDPDNATTARVAVRQGGGGPLVARVRLSPGGSRLAVNCEGSPCIGKKTGKKIAAHKSGTKRTYVRMANGKMKAGRKSTTVKV